MSVSPYWGAFRKRVMFYAMDELSKEREGLDTKAKILEKLHKAENDFQIQLGAVSCLHTGILREDDAKIIMEEEGMGDP